MNAKVEKGSRPGRGGAKSVSSMTKSERKVSASLASVYALRMLGIFLLLPVFTLFAEGLEGGSNKTMVGLAFGIYGLTQALLQLPFGFLSDRFGRKRVLYVGLAIFAAGSFVCAMATSVEAMVWGRALQGAGAISAVVTALLADLTRDEVRVRAMSMIGMSIGLTFSLSLVISPLLDRTIGVKGIFVLMGVMVLLAIAYIGFRVPTPAKTRSHEDQEAKAGMLPLVFKDPQLWILNFGIFVLHCAQMALFFALPHVLMENFGMPKESHWYVYLPVTLLGLVLMVPAVILGETRGKIKEALLASVALLFVAQSSPALSQQSLWGIFFALGLYFVGLDVLEAILPSWVSKMTPARVKGTAMGVYSTLMSLGIFSGSVVGGFLSSRHGYASVFIFNAVLMALWFLLSLLLRRPRIVKTLMFGVKTEEASTLDGAIADLLAMPGVVEVSASQDRRTVYVRVESKVADVPAIEGFAQDRL